MKTMTTTYTQAAIRAISLMALTLFMSASHAQINRVQGSLAEHETRRQSFKKMCANPTPSQRDSLEILAKGEGQVLGAAFCGQVENYYFGYPGRPRDMSGLAFKSNAVIRDISVFQYFAGLYSFGVDNEAKDLSPLIHLKALERLGIGGNKNIIDIGVVSNLKNLEHLSLADTKVESLEPLAALSNLKTLNLMMDRNHLGLPGRTGLEPLRHLKNLTKLDITLEEPLGDQLKDLHQLKSLVIYGPVKDVCSLKNLTKLTLLYLINSGIKDVACLKDLKELVIMDLGDNPIKSLAELAPMPALTHLRVENTLIEDLSAFTGKQDMFDVNAKGAPLRWCSPKTARDIKNGVSCLNPDGTEKPWWKRALRL